MKLAGLDYSISNPGYSKFFNAHSLSRNEAGLDQLLNAHSKVKRTSSKTSIKNVTL